MTISVIIPCYNSASWVARAVDSVLMQSLPADEIIVVDDGSHDDPERVLLPYGGRIKIVRRENGGLAAARNTGCSESSGEWLLFLDADDILLTNALRDLAETARNSDAGVVYGFVLQRQADAMDAKLHGRPYAVGNPPIPAKAHFWWTPIPTAGAALIRSSVNKEAGGFDENFRQVEDAEYWLRCGVVTSFAHCDSVVLDKTYTPTSLGQQTEGSIWYRLQLQRKFLLWCQKMGIDTSFLDVTPKKMINHALKRIHHEKAWSMMEPILDQARDMGVHSMWTWRSQIMTTLLKVSGLMKKSNSYPVVYSKWSDR